MVSSSSKMSVNTAANKMVPGMPPGVAGVLPAQYMIGANAAAGFPAYLANLQAQPAMAAAYGYGGHQLEDLASLQRSTLLIGDRITIDRSAASQEKNSNWLLENIYKTGMSDSDIVLMCEGESIPCHRLVLAGASDYFKRLLKPTFKEYEDGCSSLSLQCSGEVGRNIVKFLYTDEIEETVFDDNIEDFLKLANMLIIERLKQRAEQRMLELLDRHNMVAFFIAGACFKAEKIREAAKKFLQLNLAWFHKQEDRRKAFGEHTDLLAEVCTDQQ